MLKSSPKARGTAFESWLVTWLVNQVWGVSKAYRLAEGGSKDKGDVYFKDTYGAEWYIEAKATQTLNVTRVLSKARIKSGAPEYTVLAWKRLAKLKDGQKHRRPDGEPVVIVMGLDTFEALLDRD